MTLTRPIRRAGNSTRLVKVAVTNVSDVSQPSAWVPPKPLEAKNDKTGYQYH
ncbi:MAG: hypothetical protein WDO16_20280 [Bacteroidota bacterium]